LQLIDKPSHGEARELLASASLVGLGGVAERQKWGGGGVKPDTFPGGAWQGESWRRQTSQDEKVELKVWGSVCQLLRDHTDTHRHTNTQRHRYTHIHKHTHTHTHTEAHLVQL
jgi:hypothetical protein